MEVKELLEKGLADIKAKVDGLKDEFKAEVQSELKAIETKLEEAKNASLSKEDAEKMQSHLDKLDVKLQGLGNNGKTDAKSIAEQIEKKFSEESVLKAVTELKNNRGAAVNMEVKAVGSMLLSGYNVSGMTTTMDNAVASQPKKAPLFRNIVNVFTLSGNKVTWVNKVAGEGGAGMTAEGAAKSQLDFDFVEESASVRKITAYVKVSKEALDDLSFLRNEINTELVDAIQAKLDAQISNGNGTAPNLKGILQYAPTFSVAGTSFEGAVANANHLDVLRTAVALVAKENFTPNYVAVNPIDAALMDLEKGTDGHYILPPFTTANGAQISGVQVIESQSIEAGKFLVGDFTKSNLGVKEEININLGYENDDFTKNLVTILAEMRGVHYIKDQHKKAFVQGTFSTAVNAIKVAVV